MWKRKKAKRDGGAEERQGLTKNREILMNRHRAMVGERGRRRISKKKEKRNIEDRGHEVIDERRQRGTNDYLECSQSLHNIAKAV